MAKYHLHRQGDQFYATLADGTSSKLYFTLKAAESWAKRMSA